MKRAIVLAVAVATTLSGCALQRIKDTEARVDDSYGEHAASAASMRKVRDRAVEVSIVLGCPKPRSYGHRPRRIQHRFNVQSPLFQPRRSASLNSGRR